MIYYQKGSVDTEFSNEEMMSALYSVLDKISNVKKVLALPPDYTRFHSQAGTLTRYAWDYYGDRLTDILPAIGTHFPMTEAEIGTMFPGVPHALFREHNWRKDIVTVGEVPPDFIKEVSGSKLNYSWPAQVNKLLLQDDFDLILSLGQVVPHEVVGMANYNKNIFVGTGGTEGINKSHFLGAVYGMEKMMGRADTPVRKVLNYASDNFTSNLPIVYVLTVVARGNDGKLKVKGLYIGDDYETFKLAADLSFKVNFQMLEKPLKKVVVYLDPAEFKSTWLGNKSIYRTRMAIEDGGELIVLAPGLKEFGEDKEIDKLIRKHGYLTTPEILELVNHDEDLRDNLSAAAHLIHGSSENRFKVTYCPGFLSKQEITGVNYHHAELKEMLHIYNPEELKDGFNTMPNGEEIFFISNPALGLWSCKEKFI